MISKKSLVIGGALAAALYATAPRAHAASCDTVATNVIYVGGSTAFGPVVQAFDTAFAAAGTDVQLVYANAATQKGSCTGVGFIVADATPTGTCAAGACVSGVGAGLYYNAAGVAQACDIPDNTHLDVVFSDVFATSCAGVATLDPTIKDTQGPVQAMVFIIPRALPSFQQAITAEEAYFVFGFGGVNGMATPWLDNTQGFTHQIIRNKGSGTQQMIGRAAGLPGDYINQGKMKGTDAGGTGGVLSGVAASTDASTIGIVGAADYDQHRDALRELAFKNFGQWFAYYPDSSPSSFDKVNVRDGHYWIWGPVHILTRMNGAATARPNAQVFLDYISGKTALPGATPPKVLDVIINAHVIPQCAMKVSRTSEVGPISKYTDAAPCGCYFEQKATGSTQCTACTGDDGTACSGGGVCRHKFCEAN